MNQISRTMLGRLERVRGGSLQRPGVGGLGRIFFAASLMVSEACSESTGFEQPLSVSVSTTTPTAAVGETVLFEVSATGGFLVGILLDYGDEEADTFNLTTPTTSITSTLSHEYQAAGMFLVEAQAKDVQEGLIASTITVTISP